MKTLKKSQTQKTLGVGSLLLGTLCVSGPLHAQVTYNVAGLADFTGPYADIMKDMTACRRGVLDWWNDEVGKTAGVSLNVKDYDTRYDVAQVASLWPGIKSELNPVAIFGVGGPDTNALQQRLPNDKVPLILATAGYGFAWKGDNWVFNMRATYPHEAAAFYTWMQKKSGGKAPVKLGLISSEVSPAYVDIHKGVEKFAKDNPTVVEVVETIYTEAQPTDLTQQVNRLLRKGATVLQVFNNTASVVATRRALQSLGKTNVPIVVSAHNGLVASGKALGGLNQMEGNYEVYGMAMATEDDTPAKTFFEKLRSQYKLQANFNSNCVMGLSQGLIVARAVEYATKAKGPSALTGNDVRTALLTASFPSERSFGVLPNIKFNNDAPFPTSGMTVNIGTVEKGKYRTIEQNVPVPVLNKW
ncbi:MAG: ABC transporter substrate-binding protein [Proteobacteria bacterium]|jgi:branched-chain amino acid transport system substrate-binding protein|nr:ABC transporter substrate-binding protein [Pseudomonadota bacterium]